MANLESVITQNYTDIKNSTLIELKAPESFKNISSEGLIVKNKFFYPALAANAMPNIDNFLKLLNGSIRRFSLSAKELKEHREYTLQGDDIKAEEINSRGRKRFVKYAAEAAKRAGEIGELTLFIILEAYLEAPKIASKMRLKTSDSMHVHGSDALHATLGENDILTVILGESKFHKQASNARKDAIESIRGCISDYLKLGKEIEIIEANIDQELLDEELRNRILEYFGTFNPKNNYVKKSFAILLGYDRKSLYKGLSDIPDINERKVELEKRYLEHAESSVQDFFELLKLEDESYFKQVEFVYILLPFPDIRIIKEQFYKIAGLEKPEE
ncbi:HamA C-terminal domain-containing protein [Marinobacter salarius]|uniref:Anti-bacteriophage protein A/HamA C-terminal domain-containing protein n=1 Tax=Marinobacter salarius TaxID=1420917 RepID=A0A1W6K6Z9_9GAMM|nr:DUF1837 domain-containing protein [Marinobacter salarius]ARM83160.1 hypothetical protein MARSALSMR5_01066 [Marinobacter salarius]